MKNCSDTIETTVNRWRYTGWVVVKHSCLHFFTSVSQGPDAPIHNLPKGAPTPDRQDNNLDPSAKAKRQLLIVMTHLCCLSLFVCKITCLLATKHHICRKMQTLIKIKRNEEGGRRRGIMYPRRGLAVMPYSLLYSENLRTQGAKVLCLKWSYRQKRSSSVISPSLL